LYSGGVNQGTRVEIRLPLEQERRPNLVTSGFYLEKNKIPS
ncbi:hypothetical protein GLO73106DRAFT_00041090, partial [Gloeocapsa sp. PCC 73106]